MVARHLVLLAAIGAAMGVASGCVVPKSQATALKTQNISLSERNEALTAEVENLKVHSRNTEDQLVRTEENLALLGEQLGLDRKQLANLRQERTQLDDEVGGVPGTRPPLTAELRGRLAKISQRYGSLHFDPAVGASKLDTDILFDTASDQLKPGAEGVLRQLVEVLQSPDGKDLKLLIVGHTDDQLIAAKPAREKFGDNFGLSVARAHRVANELRRLGLAPQRLGIAGYGPHQPVAPNKSPGDRQKNRRVEIFVMANQVPVIGWTESTPELY